VKQAEMGRRVSKKKLLASASSGRFVGQPSEYLSCLTLVPLPCSTTSTPGLHCQRIGAPAQKLLSGEIDTQAVEDAAAQHVNSLDLSELQQHTQTAADSAQQNGSEGLAQQLSGLVQQYRSNPEGLKSEIVSLISNDPQILQQFAPEFAQKLLGSL
jgi:hypothetical protein